MPLAACTASVVATITLPMTVLTEHDKRLPSAAMTRTTRHGAGIDLSPLNQFIGDKEIQLLVLMRCGS